MKLSFILVHGSWHGAWCWEKLVPLLEGAGHRVAAIDLPGHGSDPTPAPEVTLESYGRAVCRAAESLEGPVVAVGHSMGGMAISHAAERAPDQFAALVYLCAFLPRDGLSLVDLMASFTDGVAPDHVELDLEAAHATVRPDAARGVFYADCSDDDVRAAMRRLRPDPVPPLAEPVRLTEGRHGSVPRGYVECLQDRAIPIDAQRAMIEAAGCREVARLDTAHSPFLSAPKALADELVGMAVRLVG